METRLEEEMGNEESAIACGIDLGRHCLLHIQPVHLSPGGSLCGKVLAEESLVLGAVCVQLGFPQWMLKFISIPYRQWKCRAVQTGRGWCRGEGMWLTSC